MPLYGWLGTRVVRISLIAIVMTFFAATLVGFYAGGVAGLREGVAFYIWIGLHQRLHRVAVLGSSRTTSTPKARAAGCFR